MLNLITEVSRVKNTLFWEGAIKQNCPQGLIYSTVFQMFVQTDLKGEDLSHRSGQATTREQETSWSGFVNKANAWWNCSRSPFAASCNSYSPPGTLRLDCGPFTWCRTVLLYVLRVLHLSYMYHFDSFLPWGRILLACRLHSLWHRFLACKSRSWEEDKVMNMLSMEKWYIVMVTLHCI